MLGLLVKDLKLLKNQKMFICILLFIAGVFLKTDFGISFSMGYLTFMGAMLIISTISMDDYNYGMSFLMTLPFKKEDYVKEKYILGIMISLLAWLVGLVLSFIGMYIHDMPTPISEHILSSVMVLLFALMLVSILIPVQVKFGQTKANVAVIIVFAILFLIGFIIYTIASLLGVDITALLNQLSHMSQSYVVLCILDITIIVESISYLITMKIMNKKEF